MRKSINKIIIYGVAFNSTRMLVGAISAVYLVSMGLGITEIGFIKTFQALIIFLLDIPLAYLADKKSRKLSIVFSVFFATLWLFTMGLGQNLYHFYIAEFFNAISLALISGAYISYLIDISKKELKKKTDLKKILGKYNKYLFIGMAIAALIGSAFIKIDSRVIWIVAGSLTGVQFVIMGLFLPKDIDFTTAKSTSIYREIYNIFEDILKRAEIKWQVFSLFFVMVCFQITIQFWQLIIKQEDSFIYIYGVYYGIIFALILLSQSLSGYVAQKLSKKSIFLIVLFFGGVCLASLIVSQYYFLPLIIVSIITMFFTIRLMTIILQAKIHTKIASQMRSTYDSVISTFVRVVLLIFIPITGILFDSYGNITFFALFFIAFVFYISIFRDHF